MSWRVARSLEKLRHQFNAAFPNRSTVSDGGIGDLSHQNTNSDHNPWYGPGIVTARDFTHDPEHGMDIDRITDELQASRDPRIKYVIANGWIMDSRPQFSPWKWVRYHGSNPHTKHFHISVVADPRCDDPSPWNLPSFDGITDPQEDDDMPSAEEVARAVWNYQLHVWPNTEAMEDSMPAWRQLHQARGFSHMTHDKVAWIDGQIPHILESVKNADVDGSVDTEVLANRIVDLIAERLG